MSGRTLTSLARPAIALAALTLGADAWSQVGVVAANAESLTLETLRELEAIEAARQAAIDAEIAANGPLSSRLAGLYFSLASHYRERGDELLAAETLELALHIERVTHGLFSMEQIDVTRELIETSLASGQSERAAELDLLMMRVARQNLDDVRAARILSEAGNRQFEVFRRYLNGELPPQISIRFGTDSPLQRLDPNRFLGIANLQMARRNWSDAIDVILEAGGTTDLRVIALENNLIESYYLERLTGPAGGVVIGDVDEADRLESLFRRGVRSYRRQLAFAMRSNDIEVAAAAMIGLADWYLLFHKNASALKLYTDAWSALTEMGASERLLDSIFRPAVPVVLPTFHPNPLELAAVTPAPDASAADYIDVTMVMSRYGRSRLRNLDLTPEPDGREIRSAIRRIVAQSRFRPIFVDGEPQHTAQLQFRYYFDPDESMRF